MKHIKLFEEFLNEFGPLAGSGNIRSNDLDNAKRDAVKKSERSQMIYVVGGKKYCDKMKGTEYELAPSHVVFSQPDGTKTQMAINK